MICLKMNMIFCSVLLLFVVLVHCDKSRYTENNTDLNGVSSHEERINVPVYRRPGEPPCAARLAPALEAMRRQQEEPSTRGVLELQGITLHQPLKGTQLDMYITNMKVKGLGQSHLERCRFSRNNASLSTKLIFGELLAKGTVRLRDSGSLGLLDWVLNAMQCNITMRMRYAPLEIAVSGDPRNTGAQRHATPRMSARFLPESDARTEFRGCEEPISHRRIDSSEEKLRSTMRSPQMVHQMEIAFLRGIREIMALYMERQLRNSMTDTLMTYLGFSTSYG